MGLSKLFLPASDLHCLLLLRDDFLIIKCLKEFVIQDKKKETRVKVALQMEARKINNESYVKKSAVYVSPFLLFSSHQSRTCVNTSRSINNSALHTWLMYGVQFFSV